MSIDYTQEKLWQAVDTLLGSSPIQTRLKYAAMFLIRLSGKDDDPAFRQPELQERFDRLMERLTSTPPMAGEGGIEATTRNLTDEDAASIAKEIFGLFCAASELANTPVGFGSRLRPSSE